MKKSILTLAIALSSLAGISRPAFAANNKTHETILADINRINKIEVHGNVELYLSDGATDQVKVYNNYYSENALVQNQNGALTISSYKAEKLIVWVTVSDLRNLSVYDNARVKSFGKLSALELEVTLHNTASAQLTVNAYAVSMKLTDQAKADLGGSVANADLNYDYSSFLNITNLNSEHLIKKVNVTYPGNSSKSLFVVL